MTIPPALISVRFMLLPGLLPDLLPDLLPGVFPEDEFELSITSLCI